MWLISFAVALSLVTSDRSRDWRAVFAVVGGYTVITAALLLFRREGPLGVLAAPSLLSSGVVHRDTTNQESSK